MIRDIIHGDITNPQVHSGDIIIGMNNTLSEPSAIGRPFLNNVTVLKEIDLGSVLSFRFEQGRQLHMLICHHVGVGGWAAADKYVRYCLDYLWQQHPDRHYGIVQIGSGPVGKRDGANVPEIRTAMAASFLGVDLVILPNDHEARTALGAPALVPFRVWDMGRGEREIPMQ